VLKLDVGLLIAENSSVGVAMILSRPSLFQAETVNPFDAIGSADPSEDTLCNEAVVQTTFAQNAGWKLVTLGNLRDVEDLLDCLESSCVAEREVHTLGNSSFAVRWR